MTKIQLIRERLESIENETSKSCCITTGTIKEVDTLKKQIFKAADTASEKEMEELNYLLTLSNNTRAILLTKFMDTYTKENPRL